MAPELLLVSLWLVTSQVFCYSQMNSESTIRKLTIRQICADLCTQGLGGPPCGDMCEHDLGHDFGVSTPDYLLSTMKRKIKGGRHNLCPFLCHYELGDPLCDCLPLKAHFNKNTVDWQGVCATFCHLEGVELYGCPKCKQDHNKIPLVPMRSFMKPHDDSEKSEVETLIKQGFKIVAAIENNGKAFVSKLGEDLLEDLSATHDIKELQMGKNPDAIWKVSVPKANMIQTGHRSTPIDWDRWCAIKCSEGSGGAACNCDALP